MLNSFALIITLVFLCIFISGCNDIKRNEKFDQERWKQSEEGTDRDFMADDLIKSHKLIGLSHKQMLQLLGPPENYEHTTETVYTLVEQYDVIDPISGRNLIITFNKDSLIIRAEIKEWHKH